LQTAFHENKRLPGVRFGRQMDAKAPTKTFWTPDGLHVTLQQSEVLVQVVSPRFGTGAALGLENQL
jgi:hypothetical protein